jgi:transposase
VKTGSFFLITAVLIAVLVRSVDPWVLPLVLIAVPFERGYEAIRAVETLRDRITPHLYITELRAIAADDLWMSMAYQGGFAVGPTRRGKGTKIVAIAADNSLPLAVSVQSASPAECQLVEEVLAGSFLDELPARLIGDKAYDSDPLDQTLKEQYDIELIAPNRRGRRHKTQDGRKLRRYRRRWKVERLFAWMHNFRRLVTRWEYHIENFLNFVHLACLHMMLRHLSDRL